jgi:hypothetical protein
VQLRKLFYQAGRVAAGLLIVVFAMTGAAKLADQIVTWLTFAVWQPFTIADALRFWGIPAPRPPQLLGFAQLTDAVLSWPGILPPARRRLPFHVCKNRSRARQTLAQVRWRTSSASVCRDRRDLRSPAHNGSGTEIAKTMKDKGRRSQPRIMRFPAV